MAKVWIQRLGIEISSDIEFESVIINGNSMNTFFILNISIVQHHPTHPNLVCHQFHQTSIVPCRHLHLIKAHVTYVDHHCHRRVTFSLSRLVWPRHPTPQVTTLTLRTTSTSNTNIACHSLSLACTHMRPQHNYIYELSHRLLSDLMSQARDMRLIKD